MISTNILLMFRLLILSCIFTLSQIAIAQPLLPAFTYSTNTALNTSSTKEITSEPALQSWPIITNHQLCLLGIGQQFSVLLPTGEKILAEVTSAIKHLNQDIQLISKTDDGGKIVLTVGTSSIYGSINSGSNSYSITTIDQRTTLINNRSLLNSVALNKDFITPPNTLDFRTAKFTRDLNVLSNRSANSSSKTNIDILFVYSAEFAEMFDSPETRINQLISFTNTAFEDSGILINLRLADAVEMDFENVTLDLYYDDGDDTTSNDGYTKLDNDLRNVINNAADGLNDFSAIPSLRDNAGADLVTVLSANTNTSLATGKSFLLNGHSQYGISTVMLSEDCCDSVFAHEIGHNFGSEHAHVTGCNGGYTGYACGHAQSSYQWGTIMSNLNSSPINFLFSNLDTDCLGEPCGIAEEEPFAADNKSSFNITRFLVSEFREEVLKPTRPSNPTPINTDFGWLPNVLYNLLLIDDVYLLDEPKDDSTPESKSANEI